MDSYWFLQFFPLLPASSELAEFDVCQRWQELTRQHKDFGEIE